MTVIKPNGPFSRIGFPRAFDSHRLYAGTCFHAAQVGQPMQAVACSQNFPGVRRAHRAWRLPLLRHRQRCNCITAYWFIRLNTCVLCP
jgi:hypothetical protein